MLVAAGLAVFVLTNLYVSSEKKATKLEKDVESYQFQIEDYRDQITSYSSDMIKIRKTNRKVGEEYLNVVTELNSYKNREDIIAKKPKLVEIKINKSFNQLTDSIECLTGNINKCKEKE